MTTETINILKIDGQQAITSLRELKAAIDADKDALVALGIVEDSDTKKKEQQAAIIARLAQEQKLLTQVMTASRGMTLEGAKAVNIQKDSYATLQRALTTLKREWKEMSAAEREAAGGQEILVKIQEVDTELKSLDASIGQYQRNVGNYANSFKQAMSGMQKSVNGLMMGMTGLAGIIALTGNESESTTKTMAGMQAGIMLLASAKGLGDFVQEGGKATDALKAMSSASKDVTTATTAETAATEAQTAAVTAEATATNTATVATNAFKKALISTGIGALIVGIGVLIANLDKLAELFDSTGKEAKKYYEEVKNGLEEAAKAVEHQGELYKATGAISEEVILFEITNIRKLITTYREYEYAAIGAYGSTSKEAEEAMAKVSGAVNDLKDKLNTAQYAIVDFISSVQTKEAQKGMTDLEKAVDNIKRKTKALQDLNVQMWAQGTISAKEYADYEQRLLEAQTDAIRQANDDAVKSEREKAEALVKAAEDAYKSEEEKLKEKYQKDLALAEKYGLDIRYVVQKYNDDLQAIEEKRLAEERKAREEEAAEDEKEAKEAERRAKEVADARIKEARRAADAAINEMDRQTDLALAKNETSEESERAQADKEYAIIKAANDRKLEALKQYQEEAAAIGDAEGVLAYQQEIADLEVEIEINALEEKKRIRERDKKDRLAAAKSTLSSMSSIFGSLADMSESNGKNDAKARKKAKNMRIAAATIDMFQGATTAFSTAQELGPIMGPIVGAINAAAVVAAGIANINKIKETDTSGDSSPSASGAAVAPPTVTPEITEVRTLTGASEEERLNRDTRVYILSSDIEASLYDKQVQVQETTF